MIPIHCKLVLGNGHVEDFTVCGQKMGECVCLGLELHKFGTVLK